MKKLISIFALSCIFGFTPMLLVILISKSIILQVILGITVLGILAKELCY